MATMFPDRREVPACPGPRVRLPLPALSTAILLAACAAPVPPGGAAAAPANVRQEAPCDPQSPTDRRLPTPISIQLPVDDRSGPRRPPGGPVTVAVLVDENGQVRETKIKTSSGQKTLDQAAVRAAREWKFLPATVNCEPVEKWFEWQIVFDSTTPGTGKVE